MQNELLAASARIDITPPLADVTAGKVTLRGYGAVTATAIRSKLFARILVLEAGARRTAIVSLDSAFANEAEFQPPNSGAIAATLAKGAHGKWAAALGSDRKSVFVCPSHSHFAPGIGDSIVTAIENKIRELRNTLVPVTVSLGVGRSPLCRFRRPKLEPVPLDVKPVDMTVSVLFLTPAAARDPLACLVSYGVHPTLYGKNWELTADFVGLAMQQLESRNEGVGLFVQGFSGDLTPVYPTAMPRDDHRAVEEYGSYLMAEILKTRTPARPVSGAVIATASKEIRPELRDPSRPAAITISALRLGSVVLLACSAEVFFEFGPKVRALAQQRGFEHAILGGLVNGYSGYLPTHAAFHDKLEGYEMNITPYTDRAEEHFLTGVKEVLDELARPA